MNLVLSNPPKRLRFSRHSPGDDKMSRFNKGQLLLLPRGACQTGSRSLSAATCCDGAVTLAKTAAVSSFAFVIEASEDGRLLSTEILAVS